MTMTEEALDVATVAQIKSTRPEVVYELVRNKRIPATTTVDGQVRVRPSDFDAYVQENGAQR